MTWLLAVACGVIVANLYLAQPLIAEISAGTGLPLEAAGFIVTLTQIGYGAGLLFIVPLGDLVENRRLVVSALGLTTMALVAAATARSAGRFLASALVIGMGSAAAQVLVPFAAHLAPAASRGRVVGNVMSGLLLGIMLARPFASLVAHVWDWHAVFAIAAGAVLVLTMVLARLLPRRQPAVQTRYGVLLRSMWHLVRTTPILRQRALYHAFLFAAFSLFWTTVPLRLASVTFRLTQRGVALFALAGVAGAIAAPIAGRLADRGRTRIATGVAMLAVAVALTAALVVQQGSRLGLAVLVGAAILLDMGVAANNVLGQRAIYALDAESRARLNGLYVAAFFAGGALGSAVGGWAYASGGWSRALWIGLAAPVAGLICFAFERPAPAAATLSRTAP